VSLRLAVSDASHRLVVVELVTQLAEVSRHRDHMIHAYISTLSASSIIIIIIIIIQHKTTMFSSGIDSVLLSSHTCNDWTLYRPQTMNTRSKYQAGLS